MVLWHLSCHSRCSGKMRYRLSARQGDITLAYAPRICVTLGELRDAKGPDRYLHCASWDILPDYLFNVVDAVEAFRISHVAVPLLTVCSHDDQIEIVLQRGARWITPDQGHLQRRRNPLQASSEVSTVLSCLQAFGSVQAFLTCGNLNDHRVRLTLLQRSFVAESGIWIGTGNDQGARQVDPTPS